MPFRGRADVGRHFARERLQKGYQVGALLPAQEVERVDFLVEVRVGVAAADVEVHHVFERLQAGVMHVRSSLGDVAQRRRLESALVCLIPGDIVAAHVAVLPL